VAALSLIFDLSFVISFQPGAIRCRARENGCSAWNVRTACGSGRLISGFGGNRWLMINRPLPAAGQGGVCP